MVASSHIYVRPAPPPQRKTHPVDGNPNRHPRPREPRILPRPRRGVRPHGAPLRVDLCELGEQGPETSLPRGVGPPAKVVDDEAAHAGGGGGVDHGALVADARRSHGADGGVVAAQGGGERRDRGVVDLEDGTGARGEGGGGGGGGLGAGDDGHVEVGVEEGGGDGGAEVAGCLEHECQLVCSSFVCYEGDFGSTYAEYGYLLDGRHVFG